ncbi:DUF2750 domain-containing protein [Hahella sp. CR1]|uniref:DUF2750 domain-containing protein n=1 Tax=Hahella sp. CR1 TaxID=2992807 RepID=UPI0024413D20|nr:DUF2750 domain-containing protein [Hahella sp. CR1]MDG9672045.1 DUF2750 domain-containing protein [Hahella sp. CR1]
MATSNETRWELFVQEVAEHGLVWTIEKDGQFVTSNNRHGTKCFPWWSSRERVIAQINQVPAYTGYIQSGYEWRTFLDEWVPSLRQAKCLLGVNYSGKTNVGLDLPIDEVINAVKMARSNLG